MVKIDKAVVTAESFILPSTGGHDYIRNVAKTAGLIWFYNQVNHGGLWDVKEEDSWNKTIAQGTYPGWGIQFFYDYRIMNPEQLGNYTYGYIGAALDISLQTLQLGSWYADGFSMPWNVDAWENEMNDWFWIERGFNASQGRSW